MKVPVKKLIKGEKGYALTLVLILLVLGGLILTPLLGLMSTGLISGRVYESKMHEYYAADAGIEHGLWRLLHEEMDNITWPLIYDLPSLVNNKEVRVAIEPVWLLEGLSDLGLPNSQPAPGNSTYANDHWTVTGAINIDNTGNYIIDITSDELDAENATVGHIGVWLPRGYNYTEGSTKINGVAIGEHDLVKDPDPPSGIPHKGGTLLIWDFSGERFGTLSNNISSSPSGGCTPAEKFPPSVRLSFDYTYEDLGEEPEEGTIARGFFSWILLGDSRIAWDSQAGVFHIISQAASDLDLGVQAGTTVETYTVRGFRRYSPGTGGATSAVEGDYIAIGNSLMTSCWRTRTSVGPPCSYDSSCDIRGKYYAESNATINGDAVPADARIEKAYLYWTGYLYDSSQPDVEVTLKVNGTNGTVTAKTSYVLQEPTFHKWQYCCFADVTSQVKAITTDVNGVTFTVGGVFATPAREATCRTWNELASAAWSMIIIYSSQEKETHQIYLYHDMPLALWQDNVEFSVTGFEAPEVDEGDMDAQLAVFVAEGDPHYDDDYLKFKGAQTGFYELGDPNDDDPNPHNNVFNGKSTATGFQPSELEGQAPGRISGVDIDVYTEDKDGTLLSDIVKPGDTSATIRLELEDSSDYIMLVYVVFSVRSTVALGEGFDIGTMTYRIG